MTQTTPADLLDRSPLIAIVSHEESRVLEAIRQVTGSKRRIAEWTLTTGLTGLDNLTPEEYCRQTAVLDFIACFDQDGDAEPHLFVLKDMHNILKDDLKVIRFLRDIAVHLETRRHNVILLNPEITIPADLEKTVAVLDWPLPDTDELSAILRLAEKDLPAQIPVTLGENGKREAVVQAMRGLTEMEAKNVLKAAVVAIRELSDAVIPFILSEKKQIVRKGGILEYYDETVTMDQVGGLACLKEYAEIKRTAFSAKARAAGVDAPKGLLMVGVPGTGKSLSAKAIAGGKMPLLRLDIGAVMGSLVGQSEGNMRQALKLAEAISPCVLWVDEIEKALGSSGGELDGGTSTRVFGTLLTWMSETKFPVYVVATANDVRSLKPELLRRFDDIMWVDLPDQASRLEILSLHLAKRSVPGLQPASAMDEVARACWGYSGAEIEKVVKSAVENAFFQSRPLTAADLLAASKRIVPISVTMEDQINALRTWATNRAIPAAHPLEPQPKPSPPAPPPPTCNPTTQTLPPFSPLVERCVELVET